MASPTILSTFPPKVSISATRCSKQPSTRFFTCSGSAVSDSAVNPTRSPNSTVATRRSSLGTLIACPHEGQNRAPSGTAPPQDPHVMAPAYGAELP